MSDDLLNQAESLVGTSRFLLSIRALKERGGHSRLFGADVRSLTDEEIRILEKCRNRCIDWARVLVARDFIAGNIHTTVFQGDCVLGLFDGRDTEVEQGISLPSGIYDSVVVSSEIGDNCHVAHAGLISRCIMKEGSVVRRVGSLTAGEAPSFGNGIEISVGIETGGREVLSCAEISLPLVSAVAMNRRDTGFIRKYQTFARSYAEECRFSFGVIETGAIVRNAGSIRDCYLGPGAVVDGATLLENCTVLSEKRETTEVSHGAIVRNTCLQWGCRVTSNAIVESSLLTEYSSVERGGKVTHSVLGPNSSIAEGEVTSCLIGPFVGFHHQSLLIAALWPAGKGNVGYGANVGSNHTGKAPDQEIICGEGLFFGLGVNIKFPSDYSGSPYSIIATGVNALPQRVEFPFSLINKAGITHPGVSTSLNEIIPGWMLSGSIYSLRRNEAKFRNRDRARRSTIEYEVFRPEIIDMMIRARDRLVSVTEMKELYLQGDIPGLGKNYLLERCRKSGIDAYNYYIEFFALGGLRERASFVLDSEGPGALAAICSVETDDLKWEYARKLLNGGGYSNRTLTENLTKLAEMYERIAQSTQLSKERDDGRGSRIISDYQFAHKPAREDPFILQTWEQARNEIAVLWSIVEKIDKIGS